jgi:hypothetical protein
MKISKRFNPFATSSSSKNKEDVKVSQSTTSTSITSDESNSNKSECSDHPYEDNTSSFFNAEYDDRQIYAGYGNIKTHATATNEDASRTYGNEVSTQQHQVATVDYGYGDASPDVAASYGYGDAAPDSHSQPIADGYGYEDPDEAYNNNNRHRQQNQPAAPRRSSLKASTSYCDEAYYGVPSKRRASIGGAVVVAAANPPQNDTTKPLRRRSIGFKDQVDEIQPPKVVADDNDIVSTEDWMGPQDYDTIQKNNLKIVKHVEKGTSKVLCTRGLEGFLSTSKQSQERSQALKSVICEQNRQRKKGIYDPNAIAERYRQVNLDCKLEAAERATLDEADACKILSKERRTWLLEQQNKDGGGRPYGGGPRRRMSMF